MLTARLRRTKPRHRRQMFPSACVTAPSGTRTRNTPTGLGKEQTCCLAEVLRCWRLILEALWSCCGMGNQRFYFLKMDGSRDTRGPFIAAGHPEDVDTQPPGPLDRTWTNKSSSFVFRISLFSPSRLRPVQTELFFTQLTQILCFSVRPNSEWRCSTC